MTTPTAPVPLDDITARLELSLHRIRIAARELLRYLELRRESDISQDDAENVALRMVGIDMELTEVTDEILRLKSDLWTMSFDLHTKRVDAALRARDNGA